MTPNFAVGTVITNNQLIETFKCGNMGGMRRSRATGTLVIISHHTKMYDDKWYGTNCIMLVWVNGEINLWKKAKIKR